MSEFVSKFAGSVEQAIRYTLTGAFILGVVLLGRSDPQPYAKLAQDYPIFLSVVIVSVGATYYAWYRVLVWTVLEPILHYWGFMATSPTNSDEKGFPYGYAMFFRWRLSDNVSKELGSYLQYRWAVTHFSVMSGIALFLGAMLSEDGSLLQDGKVVACRLGLLWTVFGLYNCQMLYRVEQKLRDLGRG